MSQWPQEPSWWQASDGKWYPPEQVPGPAVPPAPAAPAPAAPTPAAAPTPFTAPQQPQPQQSQPQPQPQPYVPQRQPQPQVVPADPGGPSAFYPPDQARPVAPRPTDAEAAGGSARRARRGKSAEATPPPVVEPVAKGSRKAKGAKPAPTPKAAKAAKPAKDAAAKGEATMLKPLLFALGAILLAAGAFFAGRATAPETVVDDTTLQSSAPTSTAAPTEEEPATSEPVVEETTTTVPSDPVADSQCREKFLAAASGNQLEQLATLTACDEEQWNRINAEEPLVGVTLAELCAQRAGLVTDACVTADAAGEPTTAP